MLRKNNYLIVIEKHKVYHVDYYPDFFFFFCIQFRDQ